MKKSHLRKIIKEEISKVLKEDRYDEGKLLKESSYDNLRKELIKNALDMGLRDELVADIGDMEGYLELEAIEMEKIPGFDREAFRQYQYDGTGKYTQEDATKLVKQALNMVIANLYESKKPLKEGEIDKDTFHNIRSGRWGETGKARREREAREREEDILINPEDLPGDEEG